MKYNNKILGQTGGDRLFYNDQWLLINFYYIGIIQFGALFNDQWLLINFYVIIRNNKIS